MSRLIWLLIGYLCGSVQTGYFLGRLKGIDVRDYGSHSTGATNSLRVMGTGAGIIVTVLPIPGVGTWCYTLSIAMLILLIVNLVMLNRINNEFVTRPVPILGKEAE